MKKLIICIAPSFLGSCLFIGCAQFNTTQTDTSYDKGQIIRSITTKATTTTLFDSSSKLASFKASQTDKSQNASVGSIEQSGNTTNQSLVAIELIKAVAPALKSAP